MANPLVSIIIATYNSSHLLRYAIQSVIDSDYEHWELIVVGDHCTDDTAECVSSFNDARISFTNLSVNSGQQAKPNNVGLSMANGEYAAFLNQDDMFFPFHLSHCIKLIERSGVELICAPYVSILPTTAEKLLMDDYETKVSLRPKDGIYSPHTFYVASSWFMQKKTVDKVGLWLEEKKTYVTPSMEWLYRAWKKGIKIHFSRKISLIVIHSGHRTNSYSNKSDFEHEYFYNKLHADKDFLPSLFERMTLDASGQLMETKHHEPMKSWIRASLHPVYWLLDRCSIHPLALHMFIRYGSKGGFIRNIKRKTGLIS